jgi:hypothetical protein
MKTRFSSALGFALLAASFTFGSSFACTDATETTSSSVQTGGPDNKANVMETPSYGSGAQTGVVEAQPAEASIAVEIEQSTDASPTGDAIPVEITQTATIVVPGLSDANVTETPSYGRGVQTSVTEPQIAIDQQSSVISGIEQPADAPLTGDAIVVEITQTVTIVVPGQIVEDNEGPTHTGSILEPSVILDVQTTALDDVN